MIDDKTQISGSSTDFTQLTVVSEGNDKQSSKTLTESTGKENEKQTKSKNALECNKTLQEAVTENISINQVLNTAPSRKKQQSEVEESENTKNSNISPTEDNKQSVTSPTRSIQPG